MLHQISATFFILLISLSYTLNAAEENHMTPKEAIKRLIDGNARYSQDHLQHPNRTPERREALAMNQAPFAIIVGCSDSRVSPEIAFDQGLGDLFVVRVAGNVVGPIELASIEFAAQFLHSSVILVLGHERCGAVTAVFNNQAPAALQPITEKILPAIQNVPRDGKDSLEMAIKANVKNVVDQIKRNDAINQLIKDNKIDVYGGYYDLDTGVVDLCCELSMQP